MNFSELKLHPALARAVTELGFDQPTPIQAQAIPLALAGRDLLACAATGSGKTAGFGLPLLQRLLDGPRGKTRALIVTPTRELALQVEAHLQALAKHTPLKVASILGGVNAKPQERALRTGVDIIVATPGRLLDHMSQPYGRLEAVEMVVLDEADQMLDMGFLPDVRRILRALPARQQTLMFSATMPAPIGKLAGEMLRSPATVGVERKAAPAQGIAQTAFPVAQEAKSRLLSELLRREGIASAIVFTRTKHRANRLAEFLTKQGVTAERIHGNRSQAQRVAALEGFKSGKYQVLVATDIAARGIDISALGHVVNFDVPAVPEDYIHRVGRTARAGATGEAFTFVAPDEEGLMRAIERAVGKPVARRRLEDFDYNAAAERLEVPLQERLAAVRAERQKARERREAKESRTQGGQGSTAAQGRPQAASSAQPQRSRPVAAQNARPAHAAPSGSGEGNGAAKRRRRRRRSGSKPAQDSN
ncbi:ATP-dependent RNA helicase RhlE [Deinobacterium chartae]|uniref:ATP-dependent RNA helicase RhlE n=1 Tax=Deinobacterium chartae TaxID=521158 RepID=A0A841HYL6_9DEIO|nr:DEAD/DEAH box helicase [Deinobacterium chartae]MBB6098641.1 ATP-dependent RNA helicase RhlE [Deinobacterium chartae]